MKKSLINISGAVLIITSLYFSATSCLKTENPIVYEKGVFPDTVFNLEYLNSPYDDYNLDIYNLSANVPLVFSSNRASEGGKFDLEQGILTYAFDQTDGTFWIGAEPISDPFLTKLLDKANTEGNDYGPYRLYSATDGNEYLILSSENAQGNLDFYFTKNLPVFGGSTPDVNGPYPAKLLNSASNEVYISFTTSLDTAYFSSDAEGNFDIYLHKKPHNSTIEEWLNLEYQSSDKVDILNSTGDDKCPMVFEKAMVFASNRPGGLGGYDLYYSVMNNGEWSTPVNFGAPINSASDEYRPVLGGHTEFTNIFMMFSSNRSGGLGGFDIYFTGIDISH